MVYPVTFKALLETLANQFLDHGSAECVEDMFGGQFPSEAKKFFSIAVVDSTLSDNIFASAVLSDDARYVQSKQTYTLIIHIDTSKMRNIAEDAKNIVIKLFLAHEICHFAFYYELFLNLGGKNTSTIYHSFKTIASDRFEKAASQEKDKTTETIVDEHTLYELVTSVGRYPDKHFTGENETNINFVHLFRTFFDYLNKK